MTTETTPKLNKEAVELLEKVSLLIEKNPSKVDLSTFIRGNKLVLKENNLVEGSCGTVACIAGYICLVKEGYLAPTKGNQQSIYERASKHLGLNLTDTFKLFYSDLSLEDKPNVSKEAFYIKEVLKQIRTFIETDTESV